MPIVHTRYVTWVSRGARGHGSAALDITTPLSTDTAPGGMYQAFAPPSMTWVDAAGSHGGTFAFWSITGAAAGSTISTDASPSVTVGGTDVRVTAWYLPQGAGDGGPGLFIDAFDVGLGTFVDDNFVDVVSDPSLTYDANQTGFVPTTDPEDIRAFNMIREVPFGTWTDVAGAETIAGRNIDAAAASSAIIFAFYQSPIASNMPRNIGKYEIYNWVSYGVTVDGGGASGRGPVPPWNPDILELLAGFTLAETANLVDAKFRTNVLRIAAAQVATAASSITRLMEESAFAQKLAHAPEPELAVH